MDVHAQMKPLPEWGEGLHSSTHSFRSVEQLIWICSGVARNHAMGGRVQFHKQRGLQHKRGACRTHPSFVDSWKCTSTGIIDSDAADMKWHRQESCDVGWGTGLCILTGFLMRE